MYTIIIEFQFSIYKTQISPDITITNLVLRLQETTI